MTAPSIKEAFDDWFDGNFLDPDGGSGHLPDWFRGDMKIAWDAALASLSQPTADRREIVARAWYAALNRWMSASRHGTKDNADNAAIETFLAALDGGRDA